MKHRFPPYGLVALVALTPTWPHQDNLAAPPYIDHKPHPEPLPVPGVPGQLTEMTATVTSSAGPVLTVASWPTHWRG